MNTFLQHLNDPEYMHVLLNPLPVYGLAVAVLALVIALVWRSRPARLTALALVLLSAASAGLVYYYGEAGYDRVKAMSDEAGEQWLDEHMRRGEETIVAFYVTAGLAALAIFAEFKSKRVAVPFAILTLLFAVAAVGMGGWIAYAGGHVRHKEFRFEAPPQKRAAEQRHGTELKAATPPAERAGHEQRPQQPDAEQPKTDEERKQLEVSRLHQREKHQPPTTN